MRTTVDQSGVPTGNHVSKAARRARTAPPPLGILGGLGPYASAEFVKTYYELNPAAALEQSLPACILYSDPLIPDRTEAMRNGNDKIVVDSMIHALEMLVNAGAGHIVLVCVTAHYFLDRFPDSLRARVLSLVDEVIEETLRRGRRQLLLCTTSSREFGIFTGHRRWSEVEELIVFPGDQDQARVHELIFQIKLDGDCTARLAEFESIIERAGTGSFIAGCTELHMLRGATRFESLDPLTLIAQRAKELVHV